MLPLNTKGRENKKKNIVEWSLHSYKKFSWLKTGPTKRDNIQTKEKVNENKINKGKSSLINDLR